MTKHINEGRPGYKETKVGWIPEDWDVEPLKDMTTLMTNGFVGTAKTAYTNEEDGITYVQGFNVKPLGFDFTGIKKVSQRFHSQNSKSELKAGDLLTVQTGDIGVTTIVPSDLEGANCHALIITRFDSKTYEPNYYAQYFNSQIGRRQLLRIETGTTMKHINVKDMRKVVVPIPFYNEQVKIAKILSTWDTAIQKIEAIIEAKQQQKKGLMQQLLTGKKRFPGFEEEWRNVTLDEVTTRITNGSNYRPINNSNGMPMTRIETISNWEIDFDRVGFTESLENAKFFQLQKGDILFSHINSMVHIGKVAQYHHDRELYHGINLLLIRANDYILPKFLYLSLCTFEVQKVVGRYAKKAINQASINTNEVKNIKILLPSLEEQKVVVSVLSAAESEIELLKNQYKELKEQKKGLMQQLLTGSIRVKANKEVSV